MKTLKDAEIIVEISGKKINELPQAEAVTEDSLFIIADKINGIAYQVTEAQLKAAIAVEADFNTAIPTTNPVGATDGTVYFPIQAGTYSNFLNSSGVALTMALTDGIVYFIYNGTYWTKLNSTTDLTNYVTQAQFIPVKAITDFSQIFDNKDYAYAIVDKNQRFSFGIKHDGTVVALKIILPAGSVTTNALSLEIKNSLGVPLPESTGYAYAITDINNVLGLGIKTDGTVVAKGLQVETTTTITANKNDRAITDDDGLIRGNEIIIAQKTTNSGSLFKPFPNIKTPAISGNVNAAGTSIDFRRWAGLIIRGERYINTYTPGAALEKVLKGYVTTGATLSTSGLVNGDYYRVTSPDGTITGIVNGLTVTRGDLIIWDGAALIKKAAPDSGSGNSTFYDYWDITGAGTFDNISYVAGERIYITGIRSDGTTTNGRCMIYAKSKPGEYYFKGEATGATATPATPLEGDAYIFSAANNWGGVAFQANDYAVRRGGVWARVEGATITAIASGAAFPYMKTDNANEYEIRRTDKSNTPASVQIYGRSTFIQKISFPDILYVGDSLANSGGLGTTLKNKFSPRGFKYYSWGGARSFDIASMFRTFINEGDPEAGKFILMNHGQNNETDTTQTFTAVYNLLNILGAVDKRFCFMSILGNRRCTSYNGSRLVYSVQEGGFTGTNHISQVENFYQALTPDNFFNWRKQILSICPGRTSADPTFPGLTEAQAASLYGVLPFSFWFDTTGVPWTTASLVFKGYHMDAVTMPAGGVNNDYWLRGVGGSDIIGSLIVNVSGVWTNYTFDGVHYNKAGADATADLIYNFFTLKNW